MARADGTARIRAAVGSRELLHRARLGAAARDSRRPRTHHLEPRIQPIVQDARAVSGHAARAAVSVSSAGARTRGNPPVAGSIREAAILSGDVSLYMNDAIVKRVRSIPDQ